MSSRSLWGALLALLIYTSVSAAPGDDAPAEVAARIKATLHERIPELTVLAIRLSPLPGLYEINSGRELFYTNDTATLVLAGRIIDTKTREDLTATRWDELNKINFNALPLDLAIKTVRGDGSRKLAVFADPMCPYCRQLEQELQGITNLTLYTFLYPLESIHPGASLKAVAIWCSKDRSLAWSKWMLQKTDPGDLRCKGAPLDTLQKLGDKLQVNSTPTLFTADGRRAMGAMKHNEIEQLLASVHK